MIPWRRTLARGEAPAAAHLWLSPKDKMAGTETGSWFWEEAENGDKFNTPVREQTSSGAPPEAGARHDKDFFSVLLKRWAQKRETMSCKGHRDQVSLPGWASERKLVSF